MLERLKGDFDLAIISFFGGCAAFGILPFALYRLLAGERLLALVDGLIVAAILSTMVYAWVTNDTRRAGLLMASVSTLGAAAIALLFAPQGLLWVYVVVATNFFLAKRSFAAALSTLLVLAVLTSANTGASGLEQMTFLVTTTLVGTCAFVYAMRAETQREQLELLASRDPLTNTGSRRQMEVDLARVVRQFGRDQQPCSLALLDLDHFKQVNEAFGHEAGDQVLIEFARLILRGTRKQDRLYRFGGEEFMLLMPGTSVRGAEQLLFQLQDTMRTSLRSPGGGVGVSAGIACIRTGEDWPRWLARADAALGAAKRGGRDQCVVAEGEVVDAATPILDRRRSGA